LLGKTRNRSLTLGLAPPGTGLAIDGTAPVVCHSYRLLFLLLVRMARTTGSYDCATTTRTQGAPLPAAGTREVLTAAVTKRSAELNLRPVSTNYEQDTGST
jgi:hypothetical protein